ncbi:tetratricopeptide repeat protein [Neolewinella xylanilytica]|uniref:tetratricopeptide repeat protein n=1 Tax=Neolewinella xylanilytica TaxID=1514080 RepID=UPI000CEAE0AD|nr:hypothetical protein [Neolewinella xylanilytica]
MIFIPFLIIGLSASSCRELAECEAGLSDLDWNYVERVNKLISTEDYLEAIKINNEALTHNPENYIAISNRGALQFQKKGHNVSKEELVSMLDDFEASLKICPSYLIANSNMITISSEFGLSDQVIVYSMKRDSLEKLTPYFLTKLLIGYFDRGLYEYAVRTGETVLQVEPQNIEAANYLGLTHIQLKQYNRAEKLFNQIIRDGRANSLTYRGVAVLNEKRGDLDNAKQNYRLSIKNDSTELESYLSLARIYEFQDSLESACHTYRLASASCEELFEYSYSRPDVEEKIGKFCSLK